MTKARDIIEAAMRKITILGTGSALRSEEAKDALESLNDMLASWSTQDALIFTETKKTFPLTGAQVYTVGNGATFDTEPPSNIKAAYVTYSDCDYPVKLYGPKDYACVSDKDFISIPTAIYYDSNYPLASLYVYPVGYSNTTLTLLYDEPLVSFADLDTDIDLPPEYKRALIYNLAVEVAPEYEREASISVKQIAAKSLRNVKDQNRKNDKGRVKVDPMFLSGHRYNIYSGSFQ